MSHRLWNVLIGLGGGSASIIWSRHWAEQYVGRKAKGSWLWPAPASLSDPARREEFIRKLRYGYIGVGAFFVLIGLRALLTP